MIKPQNIEIYGLKEWNRLQAQKSSSQGKEFRLRVFASFLSMSSLKLISLIASQAGTFQTIYGNKYALEIVFLPISREETENQPLLAKIEETLLHLVRTRKNPLIASQLREIVLDAIQIVTNNRNDFKSYCTEKGLSFVESVNYNELENRFLYGALAQRYLSRFHSFPVVFLNGAQYHGIPLNLSVSDFFRKVILREAMGHPVVEKTVPREKTTM